MVFSIILACLYNHLVLQLHSTGQTEEVTGFKALLKPEEEKNCAYACFQDLNYFVLPTQFSRLGRQKFNFLVWMLARNNRLKGKLMPENLELLRLIRIDPARVMQYALLNTYSNGCVCVISCVQYLNTKGKDEYRIVQNRRRRKQKLSLLDMAVSQ